MSDGRDSGSSDPRADLVALLNEERSKPAKRPIETTVVTPSELKWLEDLTGHRAARRAALYATDDIQITIGAAQDFCMPGPVALSATNSDPKTYACIVNLYSQLRKRLLRRKLHYGIIALQILRARCRQTDLGSSFDTSVNGYW